ncbi:MAG: translation initiation factor IF-2 [Coprococcus sp.]|jgi:translation initiation factor IF-2|nr:translation initiation factor IF-2 [Clostridium sp. AM42-36]
MRVHEFAKQLTAELGKEVKSSQIIDILSGKKEGLKAQSSIDDAMMKFVRESLGGNKPVEAKKEEPKKAGPKKEEGKKEAPKQENKKVQPKPNNNSNSGNQNNQNKKNNNNNYNQNRNNNQGKNNNNNGNNQGRNNNNKQNNNGNNQGKNNNNKPANGNNQNGAKQESRGTNFRNAVSNNRNTRNNNNNNNRFNNNNNRNNNNNKNHQPAPKKQEPVEPVIKTIKLPEVLTVGELASKIKVPVAQLIKKMFMAGKMYNVNSDLPFDEAADIALEYNFIAEEEEKVDVIEELLREEEEDEADMTSRPPVVCVMGHVDHGKTSLLDAIRNSDVTAGEAGGITQHIGASVVSINGQKITFLDTPGHEAFTAMRMRGAQSTDIAILVVAADDGVMPQTVEAINHAKAAGIEIIVAINKIDKESANIDRVKQELMEYELVPEDWGGSTIFCPVSAHTKEGIDNLLEMIILTAEILELKANKNRKARGIVIEAQLDKGRGSVATILVQKGTLHVGDCLAIGDVHGKVRAMFDDKGRKVKEATPSMPVEVLGLNGVPNSGEIVIATENEKEARTISEAFINRGKEKLIADTKQRMSLDDLYNRIQEGNVKDLNLIIKADVQGSVEAVKQSLLKLSNEEVAVKCIHSGVGAINESDVILASASNAIIIGFNIRPDNQAKEVAEREKVDIRLYRVIYNAIEDIESAMKGMLDPIFEEKVIGHAEVRQTYKASGVGTIAGSYVLDGTIQRNCKVRISREGEQIFEGELASLKRFKDDVKEVKTGFECGLVMDGFNDIKEGDIIEAYIMVEVPR